MNDNRFRDYLLDLGSLVKEKATEAQNIKKRKCDPYDIGYLMAWHEIVALMQCQAALFGIELSQIGLEEVDPERDLL